MEDPPMKKSLAVCAGLLLVIPIGLASASIVGKLSVKVSPGHVAPGQKVTVSGIVGKSCPPASRTDQVIVYSNAFQDTDQHQRYWEGPGDFDPPYASNGAFSFRVKISSKVKASSYSVSLGICADAHKRVLLHASTKLKVT